jgi:hypothetical protein
MESTLSAQLEQTTTHSMPQSIPAPPTTQSIATPNIIDTDVLARAADQGNTNALAAIRSGQPAVTLTQLREFLDVNNEVQQVQRAQFLLDEGVMPLSTQYGQLNTAQTSDLLLPDRRV